MSEPLNLTESIDVAAPAEKVFALVADLPRMPEWSPEAEAVVYRDGATGPGVGVRLEGENRAAAKAWSTQSTITRYEPDTEAARVIGWEVTATRQPISYWEYEVVPTPAGCIVTERWTDRRSAVVKVVGAKVTGVHDRENHNRAGMQATLAALKAAAEG